MASSSTPSRRRCGWRLALLAPLLCATAARGTEFAPTPDKAVWQLSRSPLECRLSQPIPYFGEAVFRQRAGEHAQFLLRANQRFGTGDASLRAEAPPWREAVEPVQIASVPVQQGRTPVLLGEGVAEQLLDALFTGLWPVFDRLPSSAIGGHSAVRLAAVNFRAAYGDFRDCQGGLLPASLAEVSRTRIGYESGGYELGDAARSQLDVLVRHLELAEHIKALYVDGYTDDSGRRTMNLELSKQRAQAVTDYLVRKGVDPAIITTRYHGSRYPVAKGRSAAARAQNRRVTVRVERG